ncbi:Viral A-type inclusion protein [Trichuris trichiura]|uniref:Viral A-type inclusion protein n=1 Tax=Trichuris trichiura TaxID=36087 RepID=A0A077ZAL1_TRITR|nr:Viral A-type inclusion protein [Trichuris trichiura]
MLEEKNSRQFAMRVPLTDEFTKDYQDLRIQRDELEKQVSSMKDVIYEKTKQLETERGIAVTLTGELAAARENFGKLEDRCLHLQMMVEKREREINSLIDEARALEQEKKLLINELRRSANEVRDMKITNRHKCITLSFHHLRPGCQLQHHRSTQKVIPVEGNTYQVAESLTRQGESSYLTNKDGSPNQGNVEIMEETEILQTYCTHDADHNDACAPPHETIYNPTRKSGVHGSPPVQRGGECHSCQAALQEKDWVIERLREKIRSLESKENANKELEQQLNALKNEVETKQAQLRESEEKQHQIEKENKEIVDRMKDLTNRLNQLTIGKEEHGDVSPKQEKQYPTYDSGSPTCSKNLSYTKDVQILTNEEAPEIVSLQQKIVSLERALCESQIEVTEMKEKNKKLEDHLHKVGKASKSDSARKQSAYDLQQLQALKHEVEVLRAQLLDSNQAAESMKSEIANARQRVQDLDEQLSQRNTEIQELRKQQQQPAGEAINQLQALKVANENLQAQVKEMQDSIENKKAEIATLLERRRNLEGELNKCDQEFNGQNVRQQTADATEKMKTISIENDSLRAILKERDNVIRSLMCKNKKLEEAVERAQSREVGQTTSTGAEVHTAKTSDEEEKQHIENELRLQCAQLKARIHKKDREIKSLERMLAEAKEKQGRSGLNKLDSHHHGDTAMSTAHCYSLSDMRTASAKEEDSQLANEAMYSPNHNVTRGNNSAFDALHEKSGAQMCQCLSWKIKEKQWTAKEALMKEEKGTLEDQLRTAKARLEKAEKALAYGSSCSGNACLDCSNQLSATCNYHSSEMKTPNTLTAQSYSHREATPPSSMETAILESESKQTNEAECGSKTGMSFHSEGEEPPALQPAEFCWQYESMTVNFTFNFLFHVAHLLRLKSSNGFNQCYQTHFGFEKSRLWIDLNGYFANGLR